MSNEMTDRERLLIMSRDLQSLTIMLERALEQLERGNKRFEEIGLLQVSTNIRIETLQQNIARALAVAERAEASAAGALKLAEKAADDISETRKGLFWVAGVVAALIAEALRRWIFP